MKKFFVMNIVKNQRENQMLKQEKNVSEFTTGSIESIKSA